MKTRWKIIIAVGIFLAAFPFIWLLTLHVQPENEVEAYKKLLRGEGEKLEIGEVLPPTTPPGQNGADAALAAFGLFPAAGIDSMNVPPIMKMIAPGKAMIGWSQPDVRTPGKDGFTNSWEELHSIIELDRPATDLLKQAADFPVIDFHLDYQRGLDGLMLPNLASLKRSTQKLTAASVYDLHQGDAAAATTNIYAMLALVQGVQGERTEISQLVRIAMAFIAIAPTWELLQSTNVSDSDLARLQKQWTKLEFIAAMEKSMEMERAFQEDGLEKARSSNAKAKLLFGGVLPGGGSGSSDWLEATGDWLKSVREDGALMLWRTSWSYADELQALKTDQVMLDALRAAETNQPLGLVYSNLQSRTRALEIPVSTGMDRVFDLLGMTDYRWLFSEIADGTTGLLPRVMAVETGRRIVITAIALKRFQLKHGNFPEALSELTPEFVTALPLDPVDGQPLRYRRNADGTFLLYSVGADGVDDGGDPSPPASAENFSWQWLSNKARDWVWPQVATAAEVQYYYEHPPK